MDQQILTIVKVEEAHAANIPFVPAAGGHSTWSTVENGMIIDLSLYKEIRVDPNQRTVAVQGGVLMKELQLALSEKGQFTSISRRQGCAIISLTDFQPLRMATPSVRSHT